MREHQTDDLHLTRLEPFGGASQAAPILTPDDDLVRRGGRLGVRQFRQATASKAYSRREDRAPRRGWVAFDQPAAAGRAPSEFPVAPPTPNRFRSIRMNATSQIQASQESMNAL